MTSNPVVNAQGATGGAPAPAGTTAGSAPAGTLSSILSFTQGLIPLLVAIFVLWYFGSTLKRMFGLTTPSINEIEWGRNVYLFSGIEALAYAAAGFLFGREVNRQRAENAEGHAAKAQQEADAANHDAAVSEAKGQALAASVRAVANDRAAGAAELSTATRPDVRALKDIADSLYPAP